MVPEILACIIGFTIQKHGEDDYLKAKDMVLFMDKGRTRLEDALWPFMAVCKDWHETIISTPVCGHRSPQFFPSPVTQTFFVSRTSWTCTSTGRDIRRLRFLSSQRRRMGARRSILGCLRSTWTSVCSPTPSGERFLDHNSSVIPLPTGSWTTADRWRLWRPSTPVNLISVKGYANAEENGNQHGTIIKVL